jgi:glycolate oxidase FAD binding subunit
MLGDAANLRRTVAPLGGRTHLSLGNAPDPTDEAIDLTNINRVLHFEPADLTLSVEAGARFGDVQAVLAERGQTLPIEIPLPGQATIGGLIATAISGPRRLGSGTLRDLLIGISVAYPSGIIAKAGGMVVKNVTGFDLMRLHHGALGTLGMIVSANFKTIPLHRHEATVLATFATLDAAFDASDRVRAGRVRPLAMELAQSGSDWRLAVRVAGRPTTVDLLVKEARAAVGADCEVLSPEESAAWWRDYVEAQRLDRADRVLIRCGVAPKETRRLTTAVLELLAERALSPDLLNVSPGLGAVILGLPAASLTDKSLAGLQAALLNVAAHVTVLSAPAPLKACIDIWGRQPETLPVMQALKAEFDPHRTINPGRLVGRL